MIRALILLLTCLFLLTACHQVAKDNNTPLPSVDTSSFYSGAANTTILPSTQKPTITIPIKETVDNNFNDFIEKFSTDTTFQISRIKFPLKIQWYDVSNFKDTLIYKDRSGFKMMDFRKKPKSQNDNWEQKIVVDKNNTTATIEIRGIENGLVVDYFFEKINAAWMLIEIHDSST